MYVFVFQHLYLQSRSHGMSFNITIEDVTDKFLVLYIKFSNHGFSMNCGWSQSFIMSNDFVGCFVCTITIVFTLN